MPLYDLLFKASVEGIQKLEPMQDRLWHLDVQCSQCGEQSEKTLVVDPREEMELPSGGGYANMVAKCWNCRNKFSINIGDLGAFIVSEGTEPDLQPVATIECRGCEPLKYHPGEGWTASAESGNSWEDIDLGPGEWADYDDKADESTLIMDIETDIKFSKKKKK